MLKTIVFTMVPEKSLKFRPFEEGYYSISIQILMFGFQTYLELVSDEHSCPLQ
jgi:hypothetical protein